MTEDRKTYRVDRDIKCCWNCKHVFSRFNLTLSCNNHEEWVKEASVIPVGICDSFEKKGGEMIKEGNEIARINRKVVAWKEIIPPKE